MDGEVLSLTWFKRTTFVRVCGANFFYLIEASFNCRTNTHTQSYLWFKKFTVVASSFHCEWIGSIEKTHQICCYDAIDNNYRSTFFTAIIIFLHFFFFKFAWQLQHTVIIEASEIAMPSTCVKFIHSIH